MATNIPKASDEPPSMRIGYVSMSNPSPITPPPRPRSLAGPAKFFFTLAILAAAGYAAWTYLPIVRTMLGKVIPAAAPAPTVPTVSRTLTVKPGLLVTITGNEPVQFTGVRIYDSGKEVPCMRGWLGVSPGTLKGHLESKTGDDPFKDSSLRLRFSIAKSGPKALTLSCDEGNPSIHELEKTDGVAECLYRGGDGTLTLAVIDGRLRHVDTPAMAQARN